MSVLVLAFVFCWLPFWLMYVIIPICMQNEVSIFFFSIVGQFNLIYALMPFCRLACFPATPRWS